MVSGKNNPPTKLLLIPLIFIFSLTSCGLPNNSGEEQQAEITLKQDLRAPASMGFIQDPKGNPISYALAFYRYQQVKVGAFGFIRFLICVDFSLG